MGLILLGARLAEGDDRGSPYHSCDRPGSGDLIFDIKSCHVDAPTPMRPNPESPLSPPRGRWSGQRIGPRQAPRDRGAPGFELLLLHQLAERPALLACGPLERGLPQILRLERGADAADQAAEVVG